MQPSVPAATPCFTIHNPATGAHVADVPVATPADLALAADLARASQERWSARPWRDRARVIARFHDLVIDQADTILDTIQSESGKARRDALAEVVTVAGTARYYLAHGRQHLAWRRARGGVPLLTRAAAGWQPHGLVGQITPWNFPFLLGIGDAVPALLAGNAVLAKPSELTPLSALLARDLLREAGLEDGLFQPLVGSGAELGEPLIDAVDYVTFTGSTATGRLVARRAAERLIPCSLELGGKNPMLVMPGARLADAADGLVTGAFTNSGQTCVSIERVYVHERVWDEFIDLARSRVERLRVGWSGDFETDMGSLVSEQHAAKVREHIVEARERGAEVLVGGEALLPGLGPAFVAPTLLTGTDPSMRVHGEETFGPVVRLERVSSPDEAITRANDSDLGLNGSVWAGGRRRGRDLARRLSVGTANVNSTLLIYSSFDVPMGGIRRSGIGRRHGAPGIQRYCRQQSIVGSFSRGGGYDLLLRVTDSPRRSRLVLGAVRLWRRLPGLR